MFTDQDGLLRNWGNNFLILGTLFSSFYAWLRTKVGAIDVHRERTVLEERITIEKNVVTESISRSNSHFYSLIRRTNTVARLRPCALVQAERR